jgi:gluconolactonase
MSRLLCLLALGLLASPASADDAVFTSKLKVEADKGVGGEGPAWHPELGVLCSGNGHVNRVDLKGKASVYRKDAGTNGLLFDHKGRLVACESDARRMTRTELDGKVVVLTDKYDGMRYNTPNDLTMDSKGRIYFSDPRYGDRKSMEMKDDKKRLVEGVYRIDVDNKVTRVLGRDEVDRPNGVLVSADDKYLYVADNNNDKLGAARKLWRFDLKKDGSVDGKSRKLIYDWGKGRGPDGLKQDEKGNLYVAAGLNKPNEAEPAKDVKGGIYVLSPEGKLLAFLAVPTDEVTNCAFGGADRRTLYVTGGGTLYSVRTATPGRLVWPKK